MAANLALVLCASALFVETISAQCIGSPYNAAMLGPGIADGIFGANDIAYGGRIANDLAYNLGPRGLAYDGYGAYGGPVNGLVPASGGGFPVTSSSPIAPLGLTVTSENVIEGILAVTGDLPVLSAVALEGTLPTIGSGSVVYGCGDGSIGIVNDFTAKVPYAAELPYRGVSPLGAGNCGYGAY